MLVVFLTSLYYSDFCGLVPTFVSLLGSWSCFIYKTRTNANAKSSSLDKLKKTEVVKKDNNSSTSSYSFFICLLHGFYFLVAVDVENAFMWSQLESTNYSSFAIVFSSFAFSLVFFIITSLKSNNVSYTTDFFFCVTSLALISPIIFYTQSLIALIFVIEVLGILSFYMFSVSKCWHKLNLDSKLSEVSSKNVQYSKSHLNMLFFNYWSTFFSSVLLFYGLIAISLDSGCSEIKILDFLAGFCFSNNTMSTWAFMSFSWVCFILGFFIKLGLTPIHLFKIEIYKGLPLVSILCYFCVFVVIYLAYFISLLIKDLFFIKIILNSFMVITLSIGILFLTTSMFDIASSRAFFSYSTIINTSILILVCFYI